LIYFICNVRYGSGGYRNQVFAWDFSLDYIPRLQSSVSRDLTLGCHVHLKHPSGLLQIILWDISLAPKTI